MANRTPSRFPYRRTGAFLAAAALLMLLVGVGANSEDLPSSERRAAERRPTAATGRDLTSELVVSNEASPIGDGEPAELPDAVAIAIGIVAGGGFLYLLSRQRFAISLARRRMKSAPTETGRDTHEDADAIASIARDLIDELAAGDDARLAIQRAYAAVETGFGSKEFERRPAETPLKYLARIFGKHQQIAEPLDRLTHLFQQARFSQAPVDEPMRRGAIEALGEIRDYYQDVSWRRIAALPRAR